MQTNRVRTKAPEGWPTPAATAFPSASWAARAANVAHDARNVMAALRLYSELLAGPGVLTAEHRHYATELDAIATTGCGLIEKLAALQPPSTLPPLASRRPSIGPGESAAPAIQSESETGNRTEDVAAAVQACSGLLAAIAGPQIQCETDCFPCQGAARISPEDLTRILINLVRNAQEAMPQGGRIRITVQQGGGSRFLTRFSGPAAIQPLPPTVLICVQDSGPGIGEGMAERIFESGFSTKNHSDAAAKDWRASRRGRGLSIVRALVRAAGGEARAVSAPGKGTRFEIELPLAGHFAPCSTKAAAQTFVTGAPQKGQIQC